MEESSMEGKKKIQSLKRLFIKVKAKSATDREQSQNKSLLREFEKDSQSSATTPPGSVARYVGEDRQRFVAQYVGEDRQRFVVPIGFLSHPFFKMLLEKASDEYGFEHQNGLVIPCSVSAFQEAVNAIQFRNGNFAFGNLAEEFI